MRASGYDRVVADWYCEPAWCVEAMLDVEEFVGRSWDPSCGGGNIPKTMLARGLDCVGSDIEDRGYGETGLDFFASERRVDNIVSNPPYEGIERYIDHALNLASRKVVLLARLALLEGIKRRHLFQTWPLARVLVSSRRISMPPGGTDIVAKGGSVAYAWFVFERGNAGPPIIGWI